MVSRIGAGKEEILKEWLDNMNCKRKRLARKAPYRDMNEKVLEFFCDCHARDIPVTGPMLQEAAKKAAVEEGELGFKASNG